MSGPEGLLVVDEQPPGQGGQEAGERERGDAQPQGAEGEGLSPRFVLPQCDERPTEATGPHAPHREDGQDQDDEDQVVDAGRRVVVDASEDRVALDPPRRDPVEELAVEEVRVHGQGEGEGRDAQEQTLEAQGGQPDHHGGDGSGQAADEQGQAEIQAPLGRGQLGNKPVSAWQPAIKKFMDRVGNKIKAEYEEQAGG